MRALCAGMQPKRFVRPWGFGEAQRCGAATEGIPYRGLRTQYVLADLANKEILMFRLSFRLD